MNDPTLHRPKTLLVIRHAKSSWDWQELSDFERPLNERGKRDAPEMARRLLGKQIRVDALVSSPAKRARKTAEYFAEELGFSKTDIRFFPQLYHAAPETFFDVVQQLDDACSTVALFSHNPGITAFVNQLVPGVRLDQMPTCGIFAVSMESGSWKDFAHARRRFLFFDYPKNTGQAE